MVEGCAEAKLLPSWQQESESEKEPKDQLSPGSRGKEDECVGVAIKANGGQVLVVLACNPNYLGG
jgi:hypothetical protein